MCEAKDKIFIDSAKPVSDKLHAILDYYSVKGIDESERNVNSDSTKEEINKEWSKINQNRQNVYLYYEYVQFKRAKFKCTKVEYDEQTGRIIKMDFEFTEKFE